MTEPLDLILPEEFAADLAADELTDDPSRWRKANERRPSIAEDLKLPLALFTHREASSRITTLDAQHLKNAVFALRALPRAGEYIHMVTGQAFTGFDLLPALLKLAGAKSFETLSLTTLGFSRINLQGLARFLAGDRVPPGQLRILCSDFFRRADQKLWAIGREQADRLGYGFRSTRNHTKLILARIAEKSYVVESSANLRSCSNLEQFVLTQSADLLKFHEGWLARVWEIAEP